MKKQVATWAVLMAMGFAAVGLSACSGSSGDQNASTVASGTSSASHGPRKASQRAAVTTPGAASVTGNGGMNVVSSQPDRQYLADLMQNPEFYDAFGAMAGSDKLPTWVSEGGTATPVKTVTVDGQSFLKAQACRPEGCPGAQIVLLYDKDAHTMQGVFVKDPATGVKAKVSDKAEWTWLGHPDDAVKAWLKHDLTTR